MKTSYTLVSTGWQNMAPQAEDLQGADCDRIFQNVACAVETLYGKVGSLSIEELTRRVSAKAPFIPAFGTEM